MLLQHLGGMDSDQPKKRSLEYDPLLVHSTRKRSCLNSTSPAENNNLTGTNIESKTRSATMELPTKSGGDTVPMAANEPSILSRLCQYSNTRVEKNQNLSSALVRQSYASAADSVRKGLILSLTSENVLDVESMIDLANAAFASLSSLKADFAALYEAVRDYILYHCQLSEATKEHESNECLLEMIAWLNDCCILEIEAAKKFKSIGNALTKAATDGDMLKSRISETRELLKELEEKLEKGDKEIDSLQAEWNTVAKICVLAHTECENLVKEIEEKNKKQEQIDGRCDKARAGIERAKALLSSLH